MFVRIYHPWRIASSPLQAGSITLRKHAYPGTAHPTPLDPKIKGQIHIKQNKISLSLIKY
jgi:hypothetical protein